VSEDAASDGTTTTTWEVIPVDARSRVDVRADDVPDGINAADGSLLHLRCRSRPYRFGFSRTAEAQPRARLGVPLGRARREPVDDEVCGDLGGPGGRGHLLRLCGDGCVGRDSVGRQHSRQAHRHAVGALYDYVFSQRPKRCANHRSVGVFRQRGKNPHPRTDVRVAYNVAQKIGDRYKWRATSPRKRIRVGKRYYARIKREHRCQSDTSRTVRVRAD
jgi:hypothetical protein